ncbi:MAG: hypothetical protein PVI40_02045 [Chlamydiota bacterium]|jgi:hypothetical protein
MPKDKDGWVNVEEIKPPPYEICDLLLDDKKIKIGWWAECVPFFLFEKGK